GSPSRRSAYEHPRTANRPGELNMTMEARSTARLRGVIYCPDSIGQSMRIALALKRGWRLALGLTLGCILAFSQLLVPFASTSTGAMQANGGRLWVGADHKVFRVSSDGEAAVQIPKVEGYFYRITPIGDHLWIAASGNLYRAKSDGRASCKLRA